MNYVFILAILSVLILSFFLKASLLSNKGWVEMDSIHHLSMGLWVKQNCGLPDIIARYNQNEKYTYPPLLHIIISKFPEKKMWYAQFLGPVCDFAIGLMIGIYAGHDFGWTIAWIAVTSYAFTPYLFSAYIGASAEALAVTFLAFSLFILSLALNAQLSIQFPLVILSASGISAVILTHRSTTEALLAIVLVESIGLHQLIFVEATILGLIFSLTLLRGRLIVNLADQFRMIQLFALDKSKVYTRLLRSGKFLDFIEMVWEPRSVFVNFPLVIFIPMVFYLKLINISPFLFYWMLSLLILYVSWIPGKGLRRLGAIGPPLSIMVAEIASKVPWVLFFIFISVASALTLKYVHTIKPRKQFVSDKLIEACEFLKTIETCRSGTSYSYEQVVQFTVLH